MTPQGLILTGFSLTVILSLLIGAWGRKNANSTIASFFWGDNNLTASQGVHLNLSTSFALNGVLYSAWLGYIAGWASVLPQVIWCAGFVFLARYSRRLAHLSRTGTLHGNIGYTFGASAAGWAALASVVGFTLLFGWELFIGASMFKSVMPATGADIEAILYFALAGIAAIYCMLGGLRGNLRANKFQNYLAALSVIAAILYLWFFITTTQPFSWHDFVDISTLPALKSELTVPGIITNIVLFTVYQFVDMSVWQNISAISKEARAPKRALWISAFWVFIFPGVTGSALGMLMRSVDGINSSTIVPQILDATGGNPYIFTFLVMGFFAMMLSTVDGLLLAGCQALTWDLTDRKAVLRILLSREAAELTETDIVDTHALAHRLFSQQDAVSQGLWPTFSDESKTILSHASNHPTDRVLTVLLDELNKAIGTGSPVLTGPTRKSSGDLASFNGSPPIVERKAALSNRTALEDAYPDVILYNQLSKTFREEVCQGKSLELEEDNLVFAEAKALDHAKYAIIFLALLGGAATLYIIRWLGPDKNFNLIYIAYVAQMALFPAIWVIIRGERNKQKRGALSISLGLLVGLATAIYGLVINPAFVPWAPTVALGVACLFYWPFRKVNSVTSVHT